MQRWLASPLACSASPPDRVVMVARARLPKRCCVVRRQLAFIGAPLPHVRAGGCPRTAFQLFTWDDAWPTGSLQSLSIAMLARSAVE